MAPAGFMLVQNKGGLEGLFNVCQCNKGTVLSELLIVCLCCHFNVIFSLSVNNEISVFMCLAGFPAARRCHSCVQIKNGKDSK